MAAYDGFAKYKSRSLAQTRYRMPLKGAQDASHTAKASRVAIREAFLRRALANPSQDANCGSISAPWPVKTAQHITMKSPERSCPITLPARRSAKLQRVPSKANPEMPDGARHRVFSRIYEDNRAVPSAKANRTGEFCPSAGPSRRSAPEESLDKP